MIRRDHPYAVVESIENPEHDHCVDLFVRPDGSYGFEEFRRDPEDGEWRVIGYHAGSVYPSREAALAAAAHAVVWLRDNPPRSRP